VGRVGRREGDGQQQEVYVVVPDVHGRFVERGVRRWARSGAIPAPLRLYDPAERRGFNTEGVENPVQTYSGTLIPRIFSGMVRRAFSRHG
jgi:hypothetical protein